MLLPFLVLSSNNAFASGAPSCLVPFKVVMFSSSLLAGVIVLVSNVSVADKNKKLAKKKKKKEKAFMVSPASNNCLQLDIFFSSCDCNLFVIVVVSFW